MTMLRCLVFGIVLAATAQDPMGHAGCRCVAATPPPQGSLRICSSLYAMQVEQDSHILLSKATQGVGGGSGGMGRRRRSGGGGGSGSFRGTGTTRRGALTCGNGKVLLPSYWNVSKFVVGGGGGRAGACAAVKGFCELWGLMYCGSHALVSYSVGRPADAGVLLGLLVCLHVFVLPVCRAAAVVVGHTRCVSKYVSWVLLTFADPVLPVERGAGVHLRHQPVQAAGHAGPPGLPQHGQQGHVPVHPVRQCSCAAGG